MCNTRFYAIGTQVAHAEARSAQYIYTDHSSCGNYLQ